MEEYVRVNHPTNLWGGCGCFKDTVSFARAQGASHATARIYAGLPATEMHSVGLYLMEMGDEGFSGHSTSAQDRIHEKEWVVLGPVPREEIFFSTNELDRLVAGETVNNELFALDPARCPETFSGADLASPAAVLACLVRHNCYESVKYILDNHLAPPSDAALVCAVTKGVPLKPITDVDRPVALDPPAFSP